MVSNYSKSFPNFQCSCNEKEINNYVNESTIVTHSPISKYPDWINTTVEEAIKIKVCILIVQVVIKITTIRHKSQSKSHHHLQ